MLDKPRGKNDGRAPWLQCGHTGARVVLVYVGFIAFFPKVPGAALREELVCISKVKDKQYFKCPPNHGLFMRAKDAWLKPPLCAACMR